MSEAQQLKKLFEDTKREMEQLKPWQRTNRVPISCDELECFRRAAESGCKRFRVTKTGVDFLACHGRWLYLETRPGEPKQLDDDLLRAIEDAAAVCAEWWFTRDLDGEGLADVDFMRMAKDARAFGRKYGAGRHD